MVNFLHHLWDILVEAGPYLLFGLVIAGLLKAFFPTAVVSRWLAGKGVKPTLIASVVGAPLPLCSCSVLPAAVALRRQGASKGATVSFLIATPETGADSIALSYALLGPFLAIARPIAAIFSAFSTGLATGIVDRGPAENSSAAPTVSEASCCCAESVVPAKPACCGGGEASPSESSDGRGSEVRMGLRARMIDGLQYSVSRLYDDILKWLIIGLVLAAVVRTFADDQSLAAWTAGLPEIVVMLVMLGVGVPMYICASASTPFAAALLLAGLSPGAVMVFMLAGPATNLGSLGIVRQEIGTAAMVVYLVGIAICSIIAGILTNFIVDMMHLDILTQATHGHHFIPDWLAIPSVIILGLLAIRPLRRSLLGR